MSLGIIVAYAWFEKHTGIIINHERICHSARIWEAHLSVALASLFPLFQLLGALLLFQFFCCDLLFLVSSHVIPTRLKQLSQPSPLISRTAMVNYLLYS